MTTLNAFSAVLFGIFCYIAGYLSQYSIAKYFQKQLEDCQARRDIDKGIANQVKYQRDSYKSLLDDRNALIRELEDQIRIYRNKIINAPCKSEELFNNE